MRTIFKITTLLVCLVLSFPWSGVGIYRVINEEDSTISQDISVVVNEVELEDKTDEVVLGYILVHDLISFKSLKPIISNYDYVLECNQSSIEIVSPPPEWCRV